MSAPNQPRIISPTDWQAVGSRHEITFDWPGDDSPPPVMVFAKTPFILWMHGGSRGAPPDALMTLPSERDAAGLCHAGGNVDLPDGELILTLGGGASGGFSAVSGVRVLDRSKEWAQLLPQLIAIRSNTAPTLTLPETESGGPFFSVTCTVYDTDPTFLAELFQCMQEQTFGNFEWLLLDNGSEREETIEYLRRAAEQDPRIRLFRVEKNIHIIPGNRYLLQHARGQFLVPIDSDDIVYRDALALMAATLTGENSPDIAFSDECKVTHDGMPAEYVWRPSFSRLFALSTCPAAHLMAFRREMLVGVEAYSNDYAQGSHDWDSCMRMITAGARAERVPHVLYGWRMHQGSSAMSADAKDYLRISQVGVLEHALARLGLADRFTVELSDLGGLGFYHLQRNDSRPEPLAVDFVVRHDSHQALANLNHNIQQLDYPDVQVRILVAEELADEPLRAKLFQQCKKHVGAEPEIVEVPPGEFGEIASQSPSGCFAKAIVDNHLRLQRADWLWDALGTFELDPETGILGGRILDNHGHVQHIGYYAGLDGFVATPNHGQPPGVVYGQLAYIRRAATAVYGGLLVVRTETFTKIGGLLDATDPVVTVDIE